MKHLNKIFTSAVLTAATALLASCSSDYLDTYSTESAGTATAMESTANARKTLNGIAKSMTVQQAYYGGGFAGENAIMRLYENLPSQNYNYNYYASGWAPIHNQTLHLATSRIYDSYAWFYYYQIISQANSLIAHIDDATGTEAERQFIKASALTFRAYAFEKLAHYYCYRWEDSDNGKSQGLVLRLDESTGDLKYSTLAETYGQIYKDLDEAVDLFTKSGMDREDGEVWIPNINAAHAVYARAALTRHDYSKALSEAKLARNGYALMTNDEYAAGFCKPTREWIFGSFGSSDEQNWYWAYGVQGACNGYYATADGMPTGAGTIGHELIERIPDNDARKQLFVTEDKFPAGKIDITDNKQVNQTYGIIVGDSQYALADSIVKAHSASGLTAAYQSGYIYLDGHLKFWVLDQPGVGYLPFIRSSEMVLIEAEANYYLGDTAAAQASLVELNSKSGRNPGYTCTKTGEDLLAELQDYRCLELWGEGFEWSDYKRWNKGIDRHSFANGGNAHVSVAIKIAPDAVNKWTWAVPENETLYNGALTDSIAK